MNRSVLIVCTALPLLAATPVKAPPLRALSCAVPVKHGDTAASLIKRFGSQAKAMPIHAAEGEMADGMALWPNDPKRRIDIFFEERPPNFVESIRISDPRSRWRIGGLGVGSRLDAVLRANGRPVEIGGFGWDYGGGVDPRGGKLARWPGGCRIGLVMDVGRDVSEVPDGIQGDGLVLRADDLRLKAARPEVTKIFISWF